MCPIGFQSQGHYNRVREPVVDRHKKKTDKYAPNQLITYETDSHNVDVVDRDDRKALIFVSGLGSELCVRVLAEVGANLDHNDNSGRSTTLHMVVDYVWPDVMKSLVQLGEVEDERRRKMLHLAKEILKTTSQGNQMHFARWLELKIVITELEGVIFEYSEVHELREKRGKRDRTYLLKWKDNTDNEWVNSKLIEEDLVADFEVGLQYAMIEEVVGKRVGDEGKMKWST